MTYIQKSNNIINVTYLGEKLWMPLDNPMEIGHEKIERSIGINDVLTIDKMPDFDAYTIYLTRKCNFVCSYCFVDRKQCDSNVDYNDLLHFIRLRNKKNINIRFFGGEPLIKLSIIKDWVKKFNLLLLEGFNLSYSIVTNGSLLDEETIDFLYKNRFIVVLSHELNTELQKNNRIADDIVQNRTYENIKKLSKSKLNYRTMVRCMIEPQTQVSLVDRFLFATEMGLKNVQFDLPHASSNSEFIFKKDDLLKLKKQIENLVIFYLDKMQKREFNFFGIHNFNNLLKLWILRKKYIDYDTCGFGVNHFSVDVDGLIYPCQNFSGNSDFCIGTLKEYLNGRNFDTSLEKHKQCLECSVCELCIKRCYYSNYISSGDIYHTDSAQCEIKKEYIAASMYLLFKLKKDPKLFEDYCTMLKAKNKFVG